MTIVSTENRDSSTGTSTKKQRVWDPARSQLLEETLQKLAALFADPSVERIIRPQTLRDLGGDFAALYHAAFQRVMRPAWAVQRFPSGFSSLVDELNILLAPSNIVVHDSKRDVALYGKLAKDSVGIVKVFQNLVKSGELSKELAISALRDEHGIVLSESGQNYYFSALKEVTRHKDTKQEMSLEQRKSALAASVDHIKAHLGIDLSIHECVQGLVFEAFVGAYLAHRYGAENLLAQKRLPVAYRDLFGAPHRCVYLDYYINVPSYPEVFEVKLGNSFDGILNSVIPQLIAFEALTNTRQTITVLCRNLCPQLRFSVDAGISIQPELEKMGFDPLQLSARRLDQIVTYVRIDDYLASDPEATIFAEFLPILNAFIEIADTTMLKQYHDALLRISSTNEEMGPKIKLLSQYASNLTPLPPDQSAALFGNRPSNTDGGDAAESRVKLILRSMASRRDALLCEIFKEIFGSTPDSLDDSQITQLEQVSQEQFQDAVMMVVGRRELALTEKASQGKPDKEQRVARVAKAYEFAIERDSTRSREALESVYRHLAVTYDFVLRANNDSIERHARNRQQNALEKTWRVIKDLKLLNRRQEQPFLLALVDLQEIEKEIQSVGKQALLALHQHLSTAAKIPGGSRNDRRAVTTQLAALRDQVSELLQEEIQQRQANLVITTVAKWERQLRKQPEHKHMKVFKDALDSTVSVTDYFVTSFRAMCDFAIDLIENLPICSTDLLIFAHFAKEGAAAPGTRVVGNWSRAAENLLKRLDLQINHELKLVDQPPTTSMMTSWLSKFPTLLNGSDEPANEPNHDAWTYIKHFHITGRLPELFNTACADKLEVLIALLTSLQAAAYLSIQHMIPSNSGTFGEGESLGPGLEDIAKDFDSRGVFSFLLVNQYLLRKANQAKIMSIFSLEEAHQFMLDTPLLFAEEHPLPPVSELYPRIEAELRRDYERFLDVCSR